MVSPVPVPDRAVNEQLVHDFLAAMNAMDVAGIGALMRDDVTWTMSGDLPVSGHYVGRDAVLGEFLAAAAALFEPGSLQFELRNMIADGTSVVVEYSGTGRAADGRRSYDNRYCMVFECREGQLAAVREYLDTAHVRDALL